MVHKTYYSQKHWLTFSVTPSSDEEVCVLNVRLGAVTPFPKQVSLVFPVLPQAPLGGSWPPTDALNANPYLFHLPAVGVLAKFVNKSAAVDSLQDLPLVVIPEGEAEGQFRRNVRSTASPGLCGAPTH